MWFGPDMPPTTTGYRKERTLDRRMQLRPESIQQHLENQRRIMAAG
jgi:hypothetical protein